MPLCQALIDSLQKIYSTPSRFGFIVYIGNKSINHYTAKIKQDYKKTRGWDKTPINIKSSGVPSRDETPELFCFAFPRDLYLFRHPVDLHCRRLLSVGRRNWTAFQPPRKKTTSYEGFILVLFLLPITLFVY